MGVDAKANASPAPIKAPPERPCEFLGERSSLAARFLIATVSKIIAVAPIKISDRNVAISSVRLSNK